MSETKEPETVEPTSILPAMPAAALPASLRRMHEVIPRTYEAMERLAAQLAKSDFCPRDYKGKPGDIVICMLHGAEIGLLPLQALQSIAVINGRPSVWGDGALAIVQASGLLENKAETIVRAAGDDEAVATCILKRRGMATPIQSSFSVKQAKKAGLWGKQGPWTNYPHRMLQMRARAFALRDGFADVLKGLSIVEEAMDITPLPNGHSDAPPPKRAATRSIESQLATSAAVVDEVQAEPVATVAGEAQGDLL